MEKSGGFEGKTLLVVDDDESVRSFLTFALRSEGFSVDEAVDGEKALTSIEGKKYDLILLDIMMPGIDGFEVCRRLRENPALKKVPIIFVSAYADAANVKKAAAMGAQGMIEKPFIFSELLIQVYDALNGRFSLPTRLKFAS